MEEKKAKEKGSYEFKTFKSGATYRGNKSLFLILKLYRFFRKF